MYKPMIKTLACAFLATSISSVTQAETLLEIYQQALKYDHEFKAAEAEYKAGMEDKNIGRAGLLPRVSVQGRWSDTSNERDGVEDQFVRDDAGQIVTNSNGDPVITSDVPTGTSTTDTTSSGYSVELTQPLFDMSIWHSFKKGKLDSKVALSEYEAAKQALIIRTAEAYFNALEAVDALETARAEENALSHSLEQTRKRFEVGLTAITEVHEAQAAFDSATASRLLAEGQLSINYEALEVITGQSYYALSPLKKDFPVVPPSPNDRKAWVNYAMENNFTLSAASLRSRSAHQSAKQQKAGHYPRLTGSWRYSDTNDSVSSVLNSDIDTTNESISLTLDIPIFAGGGTSAARRKAAQGYIQAKETFYKAQRDIVQQARSSHLNVLTNVATVKARQQAIVSSQSALDATQAGYEVGTRDLVNVLDAQRSLYAAQRNYYSTLYDYVLETLRLKEVAGMLKAEDVEALDKWLDAEKQVTRN